MAKKAKKVAKKKKVNTVFGGVDLATLTAEQKVELHSALQDTIIMVSEELKEKKRKELEESGAWAEYEAEAKKLIKECVAFAKKKHTLEALVPLKIVFSLNDNVTTDLLCSWSDYDLSYNFGYEVTGSIGKAEGLTEKQRKMLSEGVADVVNNACGSILDLLPEEAKEKYSELSGKVLALRAKLEKDGLEGDLI